MRKRSIHIPKGMTKDLSASKFSSEYYYDALNVRLTPEDTNTLLSITNIRSNEKINLTFLDKEGTDISNTGTWKYLGHVVLNQYIVAFATREVNSNNTDFIYRIDTTDNSVQLLAQGDFNFDDHYPIEGLGVYEKESVQKVYWIDGINQPRVINIVSGVIEEDSTKLDFVRTLQLDEDVNIRRNETTMGFITAGTIQYVFTYYNLYGQESNIFYHSPLYYISYNNRGASPDDTSVSASFTISLDKLDQNFEYVRIYSIHRGSPDATPECKRVVDLSIPKGQNPEPIYFVDDGTLGDSIDPTLLLYVGGREIVPYTMDQKDNTLFFGNYREKGSVISQELKEIRGHTITFETAKKVKVNKPNPINSYYSYNHQLINNSSQITTYKYGETYRFGIQLQKATGEWSEPIYIDDVKNDKHPESLASDIYQSVNLVQASMAFSGTQDSDWIDQAISEGYVKARPVVVFPSLVDRTVICQGVLNPTVFNVGDRCTNSPFAQASWFFRPNYSSFNNNIHSGSNGGTLTQFVHYKHLPFADQKNAEIQCNYHSSDVTIVADAAAKPAYKDQYSDLFFVDQSIVTLNSPDIDFDTSMQSIEDSSLKLRIVGYIPISATTGDMDIITSTPQLNYYKTENITRGFWHELTQEFNAFGPYSLNTVISWFDELYGYKYGDAKNSNSITYGYAVYPWHRSGSMNNQPSATITDDDLIKGQSPGYRSAVLKRKVMSNLRFSIQTIYNEESGFWDAGDVSVGLFHSNEVTNTRLNGQTSYGEKDINYYGNIDKVITSSRKYPTSEPSIMGYPIFGTLPFSAQDSNSYHLVRELSSLQIIDKNPAGLDKEYQYGYDPISMRYKSNPHAVICMKGSGTTVKILPRFSDAESSAIPELNTLVTPFWNDTQLQVSQDALSHPSADDYHGYLWLGEIYNDLHSVDANGNLVPDSSSTAVASTRFGGQTDDAIESNTWLPAGEAVSLTSLSSTPLKWTEGDTYYQRYDCLKTYPFSNEDTNSIVDICSFMVETRVNIDGRYDRNRGQLSNLTMNPLNFNLINPGYTQKNNFFNYKILDHNLFNSDYYPNYVTWSKTKTPGEKTDTWTNVTLANVQDFDGDKGVIHAIKRFNNSLFCFQDEGISQILYNERVQLSTNDGVPVELANSDKVQGKRYLTETVGCQNKWSIATSPYGLYFIDANNKTINRLSQGIEDLTNIFGFNSWAENNIELGIWNSHTRNSEDTDYKPGIYRSFYDGNNKDVFFVGGHGDNDCLVYSETMNQFTSFYSWGKAAEIFNVDDKLIAFETADTINMYEQYNSNDYCNFFGTQYPFNITYIDAQDPLDDKIYTNVEFRATIEGEGTTEEGVYTPLLPVNQLDVWNEYQHGIAYLSYRNGSNTYKHHMRDNYATLKRKFRIWRCDVPRDNAPLDTDGGLSLTRTERRPIDRIRNPWSYFKFTKYASGSNKKTEIHDMTIDYFV